MSRERPAVVGVGRSDFRALWQDKNHGLDERALARDVFEQALTDSGLRRQDIDGLLVSRVAEGEALGRELGLSPRWFAEIDGKGRNCGPALLQAAEAIREGKAESVALVYANDGRSRRQTYGGQRDYASQYADVYGFTSPGAWLAAAWRRYCHLYGTDERVLARLAVAAREAAALDPCSLPLPELDESAYFAAPFIAEPLRRPDYCPVNDGGVCLILSAREPGRPAARIEGGAWLEQPAGLYMGEDFFFSTARQVAAELESRGLALSEDRPDLLLVYDNFSPNIVFALEGFGLCEQGEGWRQVLSGALPPLNPGGGMLSGSYMQGWNLLYEAAVQLRGEAGERQVSPCRRAAYLCTAAKVCALVLSNGEEESHER